MHSALFYLDTHLKAVCSVAAACGLHSSSKRILGLHGIVRYTS